MVGDSNSSRLEVANTHPLAILGMFQSVRDEFFTSGIQEKYKLLKATPHLSVAWYVSITLMLVLIIVLEGAYRSIIKRDLQLKTLLDEYAYSLQLVRVDQEDRRGKDANDKIVSRQMRFLLRLHNSLNRPIQYSILNLEINGISQKNLLSTGSVIVAHGDTIFYSPFLDLSIDSIGRICNSVLVVEIVYGPANKAAIRKIYKKIQLECINGQCNMLYEKDNDDPLEV